MQKIAKVVLPLPIDNEFDYIAQGESPLVGKRVLVPFGRRTMTGYVVAEESTPNPEGLKKVLEIQDELPVFDQQMLSLCRWVAEYYMCSWGEALKAALPQGMSPKSVLKIKIVQRLTDPEVEQMKRRAPKRGALLEVLYNHDNEVSVGYLEKFLKTDSVSPQIEALEKLGIIECERKVQKSVQKKISKGVQISDALFNNEIELKLVFDELDRRAPKQSFALSHLFINKKEDSPAVPIQDLAKKFAIPPTSISSLVKKGYATEVEIEHDRSIDKDVGSLANIDESEFVLTHEQENARTAVDAALDEAEFKPFLLHGVTGSGKTLVYIHLIKKVVSQDKAALLLVPEISLTPQLVDRFERVFPGEIAALHSRMSEGERYDAWRKIRNGKAKLIIGVRSSVFAPIGNLGIIIVDEEHEQSFKQASPSPRYNGRDVAIYRAKSENIPILLGSATPSIETMYNAKSGRYELLEIKSRADGAEMPLIKSIDMRDARKNGQVKGSYSKELIEKINDKLIEKDGIILFLNKRGFSAYMECWDCGDIPKCRDCDVSLTYHKHTNLLRCHYCGYTIKAHKSCKVCGHDEMSIVGTGTQKIEEEAIEITNDLKHEAVIERMDLDTASRKGSHRKILERFASGETDILLGTQMVAKGLDFSRVTLVGVVNADQQLFLQDFRAQERTFQLLTQVAGRAGRSRDKPGEVLIQTGHPESFAIQSALASDYDSFYKFEINQRKSADYPPFTRFIIIEVSSRDQGRADEHSRYLVRKLGFGGKCYSVLGPTIPYIGRIRTYYRRQIIIKNYKEFDPSGRIVRNAIKSAIASYRSEKSSSSVRLTIDIDSYSS
jgi:primosomal protein N' (replication factor Y) (superfamily II helicase)